ncbi:MAG: hypothetical protein IJT12_04465 [Paludibacteraceae bacterium]|nr:hypothetical protein [Paludibacteraceae bacterium]
MAKQEWSGQTGGTHWMQRALVGLIRRTDIRVAYAMMHLWLVWYIIVRRTERHGAYVFHRRRGRSRLQATADVYRSFYHFGQAIIDRFAVYAGQRFEVIVENRELYYGRVNNNEGFIMLFSHVGNTEMAGYFLSTPDKPMHILAYGGESPVVMTHRAKVLERNNIDMITVLPDDMSHIYRIGEVLQHGDVLAIAADRCTGNTTTKRLFLGEEASFPAGPFRICQAVRQPVLLVFVIKQNAKTYRVYCEQLQPDKEIATHYAQAMERVALAHPYEWFNFYEFWG